MSIGLLTLYFAALIFQIIWLFKAIAGKDKKLWSRTFKFSAFMAAIAFGLMAFFNTLGMQGAGDDSLDALRYFSEFMYSMMAGFVFLLMWVVSLIVGLARFGRKNNK